VRYLVDMRGPKGESPTSGPSEVYILSDDDGPDAMGGQPARRDLTASRRQAALLGIVSVLAFGIGLGVGTQRGDGIAGTPVAASTSAAQPVTTSAERVSGSTSRAGETTSRSSAAGTAQTGAPASTVIRQPWPTATGVCGNERPVPLISGTLPLVGATGLTVMAGSAPSRISVDGEGSGEALFPTPVEALAADAAGLVAITTSDSCLSDPWSEAIVAFRLSSDGARNQVFPTAGSQRDSLQAWGIIAGGTRAWLAASPPFDPDAPDGDADGATSAGVTTLIATDGASDVVTLPAGFTPQAGWRDLIIGYYVSNATDTYGPIQIYDLAGGGIVAQFAAASPQIVASNGHVAWIDTDCAARCTAHRYELATGRHTAIPVALGSSDYGGGGAFIAMSPDGRRVAMVTYDSEPDGRYDLGHPGGPARFSMLDLDSGRLTALPGIVGPPKTQAGAAFSPDGRWLAVAVNDGPQTRILLYDHDLRGPYDPGISVPASTAWEIPLVVEQR
jgi:hypothetical protein